MRASVPRTQRYGDHTPSASSRPAYELLDRTPHPTTLRRWPLSPPRLRRLTLRRSRQAAAVVARRPSRLALLEASCQDAWEDFVPPAAQRKAVSRTNLCRSAKQRGFGIPPSLGGGSFQLRAALRVNVWPQANTHITNSAEQEAVRRDYASPRGSASRTPVAI